MNIKTQTSVNSELGYIIKHTVFRSGLEKDDKFSVHRVWKAKGRMETEQEHGRRHGLASTSQQQKQADVKSQLTRKTRTYRTPKRTTCSK